MEFMATNRKGGMPRPKEDESELLASEENVEMEDMASGSGSDADMAEDTIKAPRVGGKNAAIFNLVNSIIGGGMFSLPFLMKSCGGVLGLLILFVMCFISDFSMRLMLKSSLLCNKMSYEELGWAAFGKTGDKVVAVATFLINFGAMISYLVIVGDLVVPLLEGMGIQNTDGSFAKEIAVCLLVFIIMAPLSMLRDVTSLQWTSMISVAFVWMYVLMVIFRYFVPFNIEEEEKEKDDEGWVSFRVTTDLMRVLPVATFAFAAHTNLFPILREQKQYDHKLFANVVHSSMVIVLVTYVCVGIAGYLSFFESTRGDLMLNYDTQDPLVNVLRVIVCITILLTFPLVQYPARMAVKKLMFSRNHAEFQWKRHVTLTLVLVVFATFISLTVQGVVFVFGITGATASSMTSYIIPASVFLQLQSKSTGKAFWNWKEHTGAILLLIGGIVLGLTCTVAIIIIPDVE